MTVPVHKGPVHGADAMAVAIKSVQASVGGIAVNIGSVDAQRHAGAIIEMQKRMVVLGKMTAGQVSVSIDNEQLAAKLAQIEAAL